MRIFSMIGLVAIPALMLAIPAHARTESAQLALEKPATIGETTLKAGNYKLVVDSKTDDIRVFSNGHAIATVHGQWIELKSNAPYTSVTVTDGQVQEIEFAGKTKEIRIG